MKPDPKKLHGIVLPVLAFLGAVVAYFWPVHFLHFCAGSVVA